MIAKLTTNRYVGTAKSAPDSRRPRRLTVAMPAMKSTPRGMR